GGGLLNRGGHVTLSSVFVQGNEAIGGNGANGANGVPVVGSFGGQNGRGGIAAAGGGIFNASGSLRPPHTTRLSQPGPRGAGPPGRRRRGRHRRRRRTVHGHGDPQRP